MKWREMLFCVPFFYLVRNSTWVCYINILCSETVLFSCKGCCNLYSQLCEAAPQLGINTTHLV
jgi:hypothetical protein